METLRFYSFVKGTFPALIACIPQFKNAITLHQYESVYEFVNNISSPFQEIKVLDWGCGNGHFSLFLWYKKFDVSCMHYGWGGFTHELQKLDGLRFSEGNNPVSIPFENNQYDYVFSIGVLEHVHETGGSQELSVREVHRILKDNGTFVISHLPSRHALSENLKRWIFSLLGKKGIFHTKLYTRREIWRLLDEAGFEVLDIKRYNFLPYNSAASLGNSGAMFRIYVILDSLLSLPFRVFCQNFLLTARKRPASDYGQRA